jgi:hypothetical protein
MKHKSGKNHPIAIEISKERFDPKRRGERIEIAFMHKAAGLGFRVAKPYGESDRYDVIVDSGPRLWRVQVKCTSRFYRRGYSVRATGHPRRPYTAAEIDLLVVYIVPKDIWYVLPVEALTGSSRLQFYPMGCRKNAGRYEKYREAWGILGGPAAAGSEESAVLLAKEKQIPRRSAPRNDKGRADL